MILVIVVAMDCGLLKNREKAKGGREICEKVESVLPARDIWLSCLSCLLSIALACLSFCGGSFRLLLRKVRL